MCNVLGQEVNDEVSQRLYRALQDAIEVRKRLIAEFNRQMDPSPR